jgi:Predicted enzyme related to lactoylglutathione lyase
MKHLVNWVEIPVKDMNRAVTFYSTILACEFQQMEMGGNKYAFFPTEDRFNTGALVQGEYYSPSADGVQIYLYGGTDLSTILSKVPTAGGQVVMEKMHLSDEAGYVGMFIDSEGNKIGLQHM